MTPPAPVSPAKIVAYTDGACLVNPGPGGWGVILCGIAPDGKIVGAPVHLSGGAAETTNNRMELQGAIEALNAVPTGPIEIASDSQYVVSGASQWLAGWKAKGWRNSGKKPTPNRDQWETLDALMAGREITWTKVKGHAGHVWNEAADVLASEAARVQAEVRRARA